MLHNHLRLLLTNATMNSDSSSDSETHRSTTDSNEDRDENNNRIKRQTRQSRSVKAGLLFPVSRVENGLRSGRYAQRISPQAAVYLAGVLEFLVAETLELAGELTFQRKRKRVTPRDIALAVKNDHELAKLCADVTIPEGGVQPFIHQVLLSSSRRTRRRVRFDEDSIARTSSQKRSNGSDNDADYSSDMDDDM